jgi:hypothetical protein
MVIEMLFNNKIQIIFFELYIYNILYIIERNLWINFQFVHFNKLSIKYELLNLKFSVMFKWNMVLVG